jgi:hypothetical protein
VLQLSDRIQSNGYELELNLLDCPEVNVTKFFPQLLFRWRIQQNSHSLQIPITHCIFAGIMDISLGKNTVWRGGYDIQLLIQKIADAVWFGNFVAIYSGDTRFSSFSGMAVPPLVLLCMRIEL